jgi:hypothetical protein
MPKRPIYCILKKENPGRRGRNLDGSQGSFMSVKIRIPALKVSQRPSPPPSSFGEAWLDDFIQS